MQQAAARLTEEQKAFFEREGYVVVSGLFTKEEVSELRDAFEEIGRTTVPGYFEPDLTAGEDDPLKRYPRIVHPHLFNAVARKYMLHQPVFEALRELLGEEALAAQSMYYYKPPGARGQALHQDNFYLKVQPGNCIAAWTAIDDADEENGGLFVVPKTQEYEIVCPELSDRSESFTVHYVKPPKETSIQPTKMASGDVLFFNGNLIHGSYRNKSKNRFRRSFISHYANESAASIGDFYRPLYRQNGDPVDMESNGDAGPCGLDYELLYPH